MGNQHSMYPTVTKSANLGGQQVLPCEVRPNSNPDAQYVVSWTKSGIKDSLLVKFEGYNNPAVMEGYKDRLDVVNKASLQISHIESSDEGWYSCEVYFTVERDDKKRLPSDYSWVYLTVH
ncbi:protein turtle homolog A-like, partial [Physella acuta]|uniref:protein turtle homolog A-like n=1 Tax=Physella acuta TaxID=109671 RepID=UPI0027DE3CFD